jgi:hypothetical protein
MTSPSASYRGYPMRAEDARRAWVIFMLADGALVLDDRSDGALLSDYINRYRRRFLRSGSRACGQLGHTTGTRRARNRLNCRFEVAASARPRLPVVR